MSLVRMIVSLYIEPVHLAGLTEELKRGLSLPPEVGRVMALDTHSLHVIGLPDALRPAPLVADKPVSDTDLLASDEPDVDEGGVL